MITYMVEPWSSVWPELQPLWNEHWEQVALNRDTIKLNVDMEAYANYEAQGALHVLVVREDGKVIGYHLSIIRTHLHYKDSLNAFTDVYFLDHAHQGSTVGVKMFKEVEKSLRARGVEKMFTGTKVSLDRGDLFEHLGWTLTEKLYTKYIGGA